MYYANAVDRLMQEGNGIEMVFVIRCSPVPNGPLSYMLGGMSISATEYLIGSALIMLPTCFINVAMGGTADELTKVRLLWTRVVGRH